MTTSAVYYFGVALISAFHRMSYARSAGHFITQVAFTPWTESYAPVHVAP